MQHREPWTIRVASVAGGAGRQIWQADAGAGSQFHALESEAQLYWAAGDRIVFPWEKTGWQHLYSVAVEGGAATLLTPGDFEVEHASISDDRKAMVFSSNQGDIDRRHIWRVNVGGGPPQAVTTGEGLEWSPVLAGGAVAFLQSDARKPARAAIQIGGATKDLAPDSIPADFPADSLVVRNWWSTALPTECRSTASSFCRRIAGRARNIRRWFSCTADPAGRCCPAGTIWITTTTPTV
jgi:hypothetical protein